MQCACTHIAELSLLVDWTKHTMYFSTCWVNDCISLLQEFLSKLISLEDRIADAEEKGKNLESSGYVTDPQLIEAPVS